VFERLREIRLEEDIPAETLALVVGVKTKAAYYKKESGSVNFTLLEGKRVADFLGRTIEEVFFAKKVSSRDTVASQAQYTTDGR